jgi:uncharacterized membrane protein
MKYKNITKYLISAVFLISIDLIWLLLIIKSKMDFWLIELMREKTIVWSAILAWLLIPLGIIFLVDRTSKSIKESAIYGALYGFSLYGVYEFTNYAIIKTWSLSMLFVDIIWGTFICGLTAVFLRYISKKWLE